MKIIERIVDLETGETKDIERNMTADELALAKDSQAKAAVRAKAAADQLAAKTALLAKLGITEDEAKLLLG